MSETTLVAGQKAKLNNGLVVTVVKVETDSFGTWVIYDAGFDREVVAARDIRPLTGLESMIAQFAEASPEFRRGYEAERVRLGRTGKAD